MSAEDTAIDFGTLKEQVEKIAMFAENFEEIGGLNRKAVVVLLKHHTGVPMKTINRVLDGLEALEAEYVVTEENE